MEKFERKSRVPRTGKRSITEQTVRVIDANTKSAIDNLQKLTTQQTDLVREHIKLNKELWRLQRKADFWTIEPKKLIGISILISSFVFAGLVYAFPTPLSLLSLFKGRHVWVFRTLILLPLASSICIVSKFVIARNAFFDLLDEEISDKLGILIFSVFKPSNAKFPQHGYTPQEICTEISKHKKHTFTPKQIKDYLLDLWKIDHRYKKLKDNRIVFYLKKIKTPQTSKK